MFGMKSLEELNLRKNNLSGIFTVAGASTNLTSLNLSGNKLTGFVGGKILTNLEYLDLYDNEFEGEIVRTAETFPTSIISLNLNGNKLTGFVGGGILTNLQALRLSENEFEGEFVITADNFPASIIDPNLNGNTGLTSVDADSDAVPNLDFLYLNNIDGIVVKSELCIRPGLSISPNTACAPA